MEQYLSSVPAKVLLQEVQPLVTIKPHDRVEDVLKTLASHNIYTTPVVEDGKVHGMVDLVDLLTHLMHIVAHQIGVQLGNKQQTFAKFVEHHYTAQELENIKNTFFNTPAEKVVNASKQNTYHALPADGSSLKDVTVALARPGVHRIVLTNAQGEPIKIVSQSSLIVYFSKHLEKLPQIADQTIEQANCMTKNLIAIPPDVRAIDAFVHIIEHHISALAYLGEEGDVLGNLSVKDLKGVLINFNNLTLPVVEYVNIIRRDTVKDIPPLVSILPNETIGKAMQKLAAVGIHRLYVFGGSKGRSPVAMVALSDILRLVRHGWHA